MSSYRNEIGDMIASPIGIAFAAAVAVVALIFMAGSNIFGAQTSSNLVSGSSQLSSSIGILLMIVVVGIAGRAMANH